MEFAPTSTIQFYNEKIDNTYKHQYYFSSTAEQNAHFNKPLLTLSEYTTVRKTQPDGGVQSSIMVEGNIDKYAGFNYMRYYNDNVGVIWIYAFITKRIYINEECTELVFETDVIQTWMHQIELLPSFVEREHSATDDIGSNVVPEKFNFNDYDYFEITANTDMDLSDSEKSVWSKYDSYFSQWGYLVATTKFHQIGQETSETDADKIGRKHSGIYQGLEFYYYDTDTDVVYFLKDYIENSIDPEGIVFITVIPKYSVSTVNLGITVEEIAKRKGWVWASDAPVKVVITFNFRAGVFENYAFGMGLNRYTPKNNKLYTSPYFKLCVTNHSGGSAEFDVEQFSDPHSAQFQIYADISASPSLMAVPLNYKGVEDNVDFAVGISNLPQCSFNCDTYKLWLAKNQFSNTANTFVGLGKIIGGAATTYFSSGAAAGVGVGLMASGANDIFNVVKASETAEKSADKYQTGNPNNNILTAMGKNRFDFQIATIKKQYAIMIDDYFTMYGYQTNQIKTPNIYARKRFTYTKTIGCNIKGVGTYIPPGDDMEKIKNVFDKGITFWKDLDSFCDYRADNLPLNV